MCPKESNSYIGYMCHIPLAAADKDRPTIVVADRCSVGNHQALLSIQE